MFDFSNNEFKKGESYLGEQFRKITHYLAEHLIHKNDILFNEKFLTLWMQECKYKYACMHVSKYASNASLQVCMYVCMQVCKYASM